MPDFPYNLTSLNDNTNIYRIATSANTLTDGLFGQLILIVLYVVLFMVFKKYDTSRAMLTTSYICAVAATFLRVMGWLSDQWMFATFIIAGIAFVLVRFGD